MNYFDISKSYCNYKITFYFYSKRKKVHHSFCLLSEYNILGTLSQGFFVEMHSTDDLKVRKLVKKIYVFQLCTCYIARALQKKILKFATDSVRLTQQWPYILIIDPAGFYFLFYYKRNYSFSSTNFSLNKKENLIHISAIS